MQVKRFPSMATKNVNGVRGADLANIDGNVPQPTRDRRAAFAARKPSTVDYSLRPKNPGLGQVVANITVPGMAPRFKNQNSVAP